MREGRSFTTRLVHVRQDGRTICLVTCSTHLPEAGPEHAREAPEVPGPEQREASSDADGFHTWHRAAWPDWDFVRVAGPREGDGEATRQVWLRHRERLPDDPSMQLRALLYASDMTLLGCATRRYHLQRLQTASLDHAVWFVPPGRADDWLLYDQRSPSAAGGRAVISGALYDRAGRLLALTQQEGLLRPLP